MKLSKIEKVHPRDIWKSEEKDFTPWLAENIELLSETVGFPIEIIQIEKRVGNFELDILGKIEGSDKIVVIENQLDISDHKHLGQLITYASGLDASIIIWVTPVINDEHKTSIDWLNEISDENRNFFLIRPEVIKIDNSNPAVRFHVEAGPSDFERTIKSLLGEKTSPRHEYRRIFWRELLSYLSKNDFKWADHRRETSDSWMNFPVGNSNYSLGVSIAQGSRIRVELQFGSGDASINKESYDKYLAISEEINQIFDCEVSWERLDSKIASRIAVYKEFDKEMVLESEDYKIELFKWIHQNMLKIRKTYNLIK